MTLDEFIATRRRYPINDPIIPHHALDLASPHVCHVLVYQGETFIYEMDDGSYWLILERDDYTSKDLGNLEAILFQWWEDQ